MMIKSSFVRQATAILASAVATVLCLSAAIGPAVPLTGPSISGPATTSQMVATLAAPVRA